MDGQITCGVWNVIELPRGKTAIDTITLSSGMSSESIAVASWDSLKRIVFTETDAVKHPNDAGGNDPAGLVGAV